MDDNVIDQLGDEYVQANVPLADGNVAATNLGNASTSSTSGTDDNGQLDSNLAVTKYNSRSATDDIMRINSP